MALTELSQHSCACCIKVFPSCNTLQNVHFIAVFFFHVLYSTLNSQHVLVNSVKNKQPKSLLLPLQFVPSSCNAS